VARITETGFDANAYLSGDDSPDWAPEGTRIAFSRQDAVHVVSPDGSGLTQLGPRGHDPRWAPNGKSIAFCCAGQEGNGIFVMGSDGSGVRRLHGRGGSPIWSGDGSLIAFQQPW
jgi:Tol biopolymer transport system component